MTEYVASLTGTSSTVATAYSDQPIPTALVVDSQSAMAIVQWGLVSVGIAFCNQPTGTIQRPDSLYAYATVGYSVTVGRDLTPTEATATVQPSNTPAPPTPPGAQLSFYWG